MIYLSATVFSNYLAVDIKKKVYTPLLKLLFFCDVKYETKINHIRAFAHLM